MGTAPAGEVDGALQLAVFDLAYAEYLDTLTDVELILLADASIGLSGAIGAFKVRQSRTSRSA